MSVHYTSRAHMFFSSVQLGSLVDKCLAMIEELRARRAVRRALGQISDGQLRDAGLIRNDVDTACGHPLSHSSASDLRAAARARSGNW